MGIMESLGRAAGELGNAADEAVDNVKAAYEKNVTPEKRQKIQETFDKGVETLDKVGDRIGEEVQKFINGFNETNNKENKQ